MSLSIFEKLKNKRRLYIYIHLDQLNIFIKLYQIQGNWDIG